MRILPFLIVLLPSMAFAQSWCPPGATWTYHAAMFSAGFQRMTYTGDTLIAGDTAQVIDRYRATQYLQPGPPAYWSEPQYSHQPVAVITRTAGDVVYTWSSWENAWDTLYWFGASIGDHWYPAHITDTTCAPLVVSDTGTTIIGGIPLRWLEVAWYRIYERIGSTWDMFLDCPNWLIDGPSGMRCYADDEISENFTNHGCETLVGMNEHEVTRPALPYPNPGTDHFTLHLPPGPHTITLFDATGRMVLQQHTAKERPVVATDHLPAGLYRIAVRDERGGLTGATWVKEQ